MYGLGNTISLAVLHNRSKNGICLVVFLCGNIIMWVVYLFVFTFCAIMYLSLFFQYEYVDYANTINCDKMRAIISGNIDI